MKTKNIFKTLALAMLMPAMLLTTACSSEDDLTNNTVNSQPVAKKGYALPVTVNVSRQGDKGSNRASYNETSKKLEFTAGDKLFVEGQHSTAGQFAGTLEYDAVSGKFSGTIYTQNGWTGTADALLTESSVGGGYYAGATLLPDGYGSTGFLYISQEDVEKLYDDRLPYYYENAFALTKAAGVEQLSREEAGYYDNGFVLMPSNAILNFTITGLAASTEVAVVFTESYYSTTINKNVTTDGSGNATFAIGLSTGVDFANCALTVGGLPITLTSSSKTLEAGKIYNITRNAIPGALIGQFSVSDTKKVYFSKGNLQATYNTSWSWAFATNQWDYIGNAAGNTSINGGGTISGTGTVDLFGWVGAACAWTGAAQYGISNVKQAAQYGYVEGEALKSDWGTLAITNGGNTANFGWRTLTGGDDSGEWEYLFKTRTTTSGVRYAHATVNSVPGLVLLPDDWSTDYYSLNKVNDANGTAYTDNVISSSDWTSKLEAHGAVFLPAGGYRSEATVSDAGVQGTYWSSTSSTTVSAIGFRFVSTKFAGNTQGFTRNRGCSVRLVYDAN